MSKLYYNKVTKEYGVSFETLRKKYQNVSLSSDLDNLEDWVSYKPTERPLTHRYETISEGLPSFDTDTEGNVTYLNGTQVWVVETKESTPSFVESLKNEIKAKVTNKRWEVESGGIVFNNGVKIKTSKDDQDRILSVIINAERNGITEIDFKADSGWVKISVFALKQLAKELTYFVQFCFQTEKYHHNVIDSLSSVEDICDYNYNTNWAYAAGLNGTNKLQTYSLTPEQIMTLLYSNFIFPTVINGEFFVTEDRKEDAQILIDKEHYKVDDISRAQFYFLLAKTGLDDAIDTLLPPLRSENIDKYAKYKSYLKGADFYEFAKAYSIYLDIKPKILAINPQLNYSLEDLKTLWIQSSEF